MPLDPFNFSSLSNSKPVPKRREPAPVGWEEKCGLQWGLTQAFSSGSFNYISHFKRHRILQFLAISGLSFLS